MNREASGMHGLTWFRKIGMPCGFFLLLVLLGACGTEKEAEIPDGETGERTLPRTIVTTDGEIDDVDSFVRMLLYANEFELEGLVYSSSQWHYKGDGQGTLFTSEMESTRERYGERADLRWPGTTWMQELIDEYAKVYPNLSLHAEGYPEPDYLRSLIKVGNIDFEGEMAVDTEGSDFIMEKLLDDDMSPLYLQVWGGTNTIARALKSIEDQYGGTDQWESVYRKVCEKAVIYAILDQDATYRKYIAGSWPDVKVFYNSNQFWCFAYPWKLQVPEAWHSYLEGEFMREHIIQGHGPLMEKYYSYGDGQHQEGDPEHIHGTHLDSINATGFGRALGPFQPYDFISEGDSPAYLHLVDVGLDNLDHPHFGGWGGRLVQSDSIPTRWEDGEAAQDFNTFTDTLDRTFPQTRWVPAIQSDFAARADWCVKSYDEANHPPEVTVEPAGMISVEPGETVSLSASATDPDGDALSYRWWQYWEVDTYPGRLDLSTSAGTPLDILVPEDLEHGQTIHLIVEVSDATEHPMTRYRRVILTGK